MSASRLIGRDRQQFMEAHHNVSRFSKQNVSECIRDKLLLIIHVIIHWPHSEKFSKEKKSVDLPSISALESLNFFIYREYIIVNCIEGFIELNC